MTRCFDGIFLDFYGTLVGGDREAVEAICADIASTYGLTCPPEQLACAWGRHFFAQIEQANGDDFCTLFECEQRSLRQVMREWGIEVDPMPYVRKLQEYWRAPPLLPGVTEALAALPLPICLVSNADREDLDTALTGLGLQFDHVVTSEDARSYKPHPDIFRHALKQTGWLADRVLHVGDSLHSDVYGANRCGIRTAWVDRPGRISDVGTCESHYRIEVLNQLAYVIGGNG